jgi:two-component system response regulator YesN
LRGTIMIIDDELFIRKGLRKLIDQHTTNWEVVGEAKNGEEGLAQIESLAPDLAIVDIRMPIMSGIELAEQIYKRGLKVKVVILTGHKDFEYAQAAIKYGVIDFLLKPCPEEEVIRMLDEVFNSMRVENKQRQFNQRMLEETVLRSALLRLPIPGDMLSYLQQELVGKVCWFISGYMDMNSKFEKDLHLLQYAFRNIIEEILEPERYSLSFVSVQYNLSAMFIRHPAIEGSQLMNKLTSTMDELLGVRIKVLDAGEIQSLDQVPALYENIGLSMGLATGTEENSAAVPDDHNQMLLNAQTLQDHWMFLITSGHQEKLKEQVSLEIQTIADDSVSIHELKNRALIIATVFNTLSRKVMHVPFNTLLHFQNQHKQEIVDLLEQHANDFLAQLDQWLKLHNQSVIQQAIDYIEQHYMDTCSLSEVAMRVHFNPTYLSTLFKRETGERFVNYVTKVRIEQAKILLSNTDKKVAEIGQMVGYDDPNYFTTIFRKNNTCTPNQYRKNVQL